MDVQLLSAIRAKIMSHRAIYNLTCYYVWYMYAVVCIPREIVIVLLISSVCKVYAIIVLKY